MTAGHAGLGAAAATVAAGLPLLPADNAHVASDLAKIAAGTTFDPDR